MGACFGFWKQFRLLYKHSVLIKPVLRNWYKRTHHRAKTWGGLAKGI